MRIQELDNKKICILGFGREGQATMRAVRQFAPSATVTIADKKLQNPPLGVETQTGDGYLADLGRFDLIVKSPGIPPQPEFAAVKDKITSATQIFLDTAKAAGSQIIGITGSKGKSTTTTLIYELLKAGGKDVHLVGNIGIPAIDFLDHAKPNTIFVQEMSSYQLADLTTSPQIAVVTAFFPEHLDYHGSLHAYLEAKKRIASFQQPGDTVFYGDGFPETKEIAEASPGRHISYSKTDAPVTLQEIRLRGEHNLTNIGGAWKVASSLGVPVSVALPVIKNFKGLPHRLESLGKAGGIEWVDDAISTTPESAIAALDALGDDVVTMLLGGQDRGYDFRSLAARIAKSKVRIIVLFGESGPRIREAVGDAHADVCFHEADSMERGVELARKNTMEGKTVLLSPASPSYDMYKNFEDRGDQFKKYALGAK
ncbi:MAG TPA: UDP-N-acetylmuramoyl-L-alanine--D-glutamate ligase [Candidatus Peribacteria bacterium]|nr:UDP-N-acetylmuramoyl-L-alanine--D-glutamate ligase [Candidatus Peribacteria bacterium]